MIYIAIILVLAHFFADFILQPYDWGVKKWNDLWILTKHILTYSLGFFLVTWFFLIPDNFLIWTLFLMAAIVNGIFHFGIDYVTSKINHHLWATKNVNMFWKMIGLDQFLHYVTIFLVYGYLYSIILQII